MFSAVEHFKAQAAMLRLYQHMLPKGITFLFSNCFTKSVKEKAQNLDFQFRLSKEEVTEELRRLIAIKAFTADEDGYKIMPTILMDGMWLEMIMDTQVYAELQAALGIKLTRRYGLTEPAAAQEARALRVATMECLYKNFFGGDPLGPSYAQLNQPLPIPPITTIVEVKKEIQLYKGMTVDERRLVRAGIGQEGELFDGKTLEESGLVNGSTVHLLHR
ncbi:hypothetical protein DL95DRAFT_463987 [Leptodontidium sp. 2 PMI_412]|nr:hypothetical protein DL95DRAFT_463987 [Leptodontidium sp. 2 PMI_412]